MKTWLYAFHAKRCRFARKQQRRNLRFKSKVLDHWGYFVRKDAAMPEKVRSLRFAVFAGLAIVGVFAGCPKPDTTKATVIDDLSGLGFNGSIAAPEYLFDTVVTNKMYDVSGTNRNCWTKDPYVERYRIFVELNQDEHEDLIMSAPLSQRGTGGHVFDVYL